MKKIIKLNNKGYMLIEIILASAIAFALAYFMLELTLKVKERNDYLLAATMTATDKTILSNMIMKSLKKGEFECDGILSVTNDYSREKLNKYATIGEDSTCEVNGDRIHVVIPLKIKNTNNDDFKIDLYYLKTS